MQMQLDVKCDARAAREFEVLETSEFCCVEGAGAVSRIHKVANQGPRIRLCGRSKLADRGRRIYLCSARSPSFLLLLVCPKHMNV